MSKKFGIPKHVYWYIVNEIAMRKTYQAKIEDLMAEIQTLQSANALAIGNVGKSYTVGDPAQAAALQAVELKAEMERYQLRLNKINRAREQFSGDYAIIFDQRFWNDERRTHDDIMDELHIADRNKYFEMWDTVQCRTAFILCPWP